MKIWTISDTHMYHQKLEIPKVDMVIHAGDATNALNPHMNNVEYHKFLQWFSALPIKYKVLNFGNHDTCIEHGMMNFQNYDIIPLLHQAVEIEGIKIFCSPYTPRFGDWAFMHKRNQMQTIWATLPDEIDILVTHGPPKGFLDLTRDFQTNTLVQVGCKSLLNAVNKIKPKLHIFGHIHDEKNIYNFGTLHREKTTFVNCSMLKHGQQDFNQGFVFNYEGS